MNEAGPPSGSPLTQIGMRKRHQQCEKHYISTVQNIPSWQQNGGPFLPVFLQKETGHHFSAITSDGYPLLACAPRASAMLQAAS